MLSVSQLNGFNINRSVYVAPTVAVNSTVPSLITSANPSFPAFTLSAAPDATRRIIAAIIVSGAVTLNSVTIGGVSATIHQTKTTVQCDVHIASALVPTGTTADVVLALSGSADSQVRIWEMTGGYGTVDAAGGTGTSSVTVTPPANSCTVAHGCHSTGGAAITWTNITEEASWDTSTGVPSSNRWSGAHRTDATSPGSIAISTSGGATLGEVVQCFT